MKDQVAQYGPGKKLSEITEERNDGLPKQPEKSVLQGHTHPITHCAFHPLYSLIATSSEDATVRIWDYESAQLERSLKGHTSTVNCVAFEPNNGTCLASCAADLTIKIWGMDSYDCTRTLNGHDHNISFVAFVPNGDFLLSCSRDRTIKLWEMSTGFCVRTYQGHNDWVRSVCINLSGDVLASCSNDEEIIVWTIDNSEPLQVLGGHTNVVEYVTFSNEAATRTIQSSPAFQGIDHQNDNFEFLASASRDKSIRIWDVYSAACLITLQGHDNWVRQVAFHVDGKYLFSCGDDKTIRVWELHTGNQVKKIIDAHNHFVTCLSLSSKYPLLASGSVDKTVKIWECR